MLFWVFSNDSTWVQSQVKSYQKLKKWYLMPPCLTLSIIRYGSRVKWSNPVKGVAPFPIHWCSSYWKWSLWVTLDYSHQLYFISNKHSCYFNNCSYWSQQSPMLKSFCITACYEYWLPDTQLRSKSLFTWFPCLYLVVKFAIQYLTECYVSNVATVSEPRCPDSNESTITRTLTLDERFTYIRDREFWKETTNV